MTLRLGFVGTGKWGRKLAKSFRACGAEVVAYDRRQWGSIPTKNYENISAFGSYMPWRDQIADKSIDAIVAVAPPEVTTEVAMACAAAVKPVMATKPLFQHPSAISAPFYVDTWRLWGDRWANAKREIQKTTEAARANTFSRMPRLDFILEGNGPVRSFPGTFDYGPHLPAFLFDAFPGVAPQIRWAKKTEGGGFESIETELMMGDVPVGLRYGNAAEAGRREIIMSIPGDKRVIWDEPMTYDKSHEIQAFCQSFMSDVSEGFVSTTLLDYSRESMRLLRQIREEAK